MIKRGENPLSKIYRFDDRNFDDQIILVDGENT